MNMKRILVLVMAMVMMVSACVTPVLAAFNTETHREHIEEIVNDPELQAKYEEIKATVEYVAKDIEENYEEYYAQGYAYADENGYIEAAIEAIKLALEVLPEIDLEEVGMTEELREKLQAELEVLPGTLEKLLAILESGEASEFNGFVNAALTLEGDLYLHMNNIYAILEQGSIDLNQIYLVPAFNEGMKILNEQVLPAIDAAVEAFVEGVVNHVVEKLTPYYNAVVSALGIAYDTYVKLVETIVKIYVFVGNTVEKVVNIYNALTTKLVEIFGSVEEAIRVAGVVLNQFIEIAVKFEATIWETIDKITTSYVAIINKLYEIYGNVQDALNTANAILMDIVNKVECTVEKALEIYNTILNILVNTYGTIENVVTVASQIFSYVYDFVAGNVEDLGEMLNNIVTIVTETYGATKDAYYTASQVYAYLVNEFATIFEGHYVVTNDSKYVSLGDAVYGEELAEMLQLSDKYVHFFRLDQDYLEEIADADLITVRFDNGELINFIGAIVYFGAPQLEWNKYLDAEGQEALDEILAEIKAELIANGKAQALANAVSELAALPGVEVTPEVVADVIAFAIECALYNYAEFIDRVTVTLENVYATAPEATVVITGIQNPLAGLNLADLGLDVELGEYVNAVGYVLKALNVQLMAVAYANENTVFVNSNDAQDIYDALNVEFDLVVDPPIIIDPPVECEHEYDNCEDATCNKCGEERVAPGHSFTNYTYNNDATCGVNGTETAKCDNCDAENTREAQGTALQHNWAAATCTACKTCTLCGATEGEMLPHTYGPWNVLREPTHKVQGFQERKCTVCGRLDTAVIPCLEGMSTGTIIAIVVGSVVVLGGVGTVVYFQIKKKKVAAAANTKTED